MAKRNADRVKRERLEALIGRIPFVPGRLSGNSKAIAALASGSALSQVIAFGTTPIVTRLYTPAEYGVLATFTATVTILASVISGRYEGAIVLPPNTPRGERDALALVKLAVAVGAVSSVGAVLIIVIARNVGFDPWLHSLGPWAYLVPATAFLTMLGQALTAYATRRRGYGRIARVAPLSRIYAAAVQVGLGLLKFTGTGLLVAACTTPFVGLGVLLKMLKEGRQAVDADGSELAASPLSRVARHYSEFPRVNIWFTLLNTLAWNVQVLIIGIYFTKADVGQFSLAFSLLSVPAALVVMAVSQVFFRELADRAHDSQAAVALGRKTVLGLVKISIVPFTLLFLFSPWIFTILFGEQWRYAGEIAQAMLPLIWCRFVATTMTGTLGVYRKQHVLLIWQIVALAFTVGAYAGGATLGWSIVTCTAVASALVGPMYLLILPISFRVMRSGTPAQLLERTEETGSQDGTG